MGDLKARPPTCADGLFHRISFFNHCCAGLNNASWTWGCDGDGLLTVKATRDVVGGEELTISYIAKPWCDMAKPARRRYLKQNFNFVCLCKACCQPPSTNGGYRCNQDSDRPSSKGLAGLLTRWVQDERAEPDDGNDEREEPQETTVAESGSSVSLSKPKQELTDDERLQRVLDKCDKEHLVVGTAEVQAALEAEVGHVGKAMIRLRKQLKQDA